MKKNLTVLFVFISAILWAQSSDQNYVKTTVYATPNGQAGNTHIEVNYFDGLGRPIENVKHAQAPNGGDIITHIEYDDYGRQVKDYLPFVREVPSMDFQGLTESDVVNFYNTQGIPNTQVPYSEKELENSPLNRVLKQAAPGEDWALGSGHEIKYYYQTNQANEVLQFEVAPLTYDSATDIFETSLSGQSTFYQPNTLYKSITMDENNNFTRASYQPTKTIEFKNKAGQVVLKRISTNQTVYDTYYVYDDFGNLTYVIPNVIKLSA